jgi:phosphatidate cytidylyltransferase
MGVAELAAACLVLLALGYAVLGALMLVPRLAPAAREAFPILLTETLIVGVAAGAFWLGGAVLALFLTLHAARVGYEAARVALARTPLRGPAPAVLAGLALAGAGWGAALLPPALLAGLALAAFAALLALRLARPPRGYTGAALELALFPGLPLVIFTAAGLTGGGFWLLLAFLLVETFDSYALLGGKLFGRRPAFPVLSPRKTVEGLTCGAAMLMLTAALAGALWAGVPLALSAAGALLAGGLAVAGDLAASRLKRAAAVKDYPKVLAHQGGLFDITDAWIAAGAGLALLAALAGLGADLGPDLGTDLGTATGSV